MFTRPRREIAITGSMKRPRRGQVKTIAVPKLRLRQSTLKIMARAFVGAAWRCKRSDGMRRIKRRGRDSKMSLPFLFDRWNVVKDTVLYSVYYQKTVHIFRTICPIFLCLSFYVVSLSYEVISMEQTCSQCTYFYQHYGMYPNHKLYKVAFGHCIHPRIKIKKPEHAACEHFQPAPQKKADGLMPSAGGIMPDEIRCCRNCRRASGNRRWYHPRAYARRASRRSR